ncbi:uncharacterized protein [Rutidosis leptorrhynchoides]|uniref:uncharacterized protein n=1 Tax=Rutidosis leptorrhynchoides TaxID=125765 RepID=UPI003A99B3FA
MAVNCKPIRHTPHRRIDLCPNSKRVFNRRSSSPVFNSASVPSNGTKVFQTNDYYRKPLPKNTIWKPKSEVKGVQNFEGCLPCKKGKQTKKPHATKKHHYVNIPLKLLHMDLSGPVNCKTITGESYCLVVTDEYSHFSRVVMLKHKSDTFEHIKVLILKLESLYKLKVRKIRTDNGTEFKNNQMLLFCNENRIQQQFSPAYTLQSNGVAERKNRTLIETARTMLADAYLPIFFWGEAMSTACYVMNRVLVVKRYCNTFYELLHKRNPNIKHLEPFGAPCTILVRDTGGKFNSKVVSGIFLGYGNQNKQVYNTESKCVEEHFEVDIQHDEVLTQMLYDAQNSTENVISIPDQTQVQTQSTHQSPIQSPQQSTQSDHSNVDPNVEIVYETDEDSDSEEDEGTEQPTEAGGVRRSNRVIMPPKHLDDYYVDTRGIPHIIIPDAKSNEASKFEVPTTSDVPVVSESTKAAEDVESESANVVTAFYSSLNKTGRVFVHAHSCYVCQIEPKDAFEALKYDEWVSAMHEELLQFKHLKVWRLVNLPHGCEPYGLRWVLKNKKDEQGIVIRKKLERPAKNPLSVNHGISPDCEGAKVDPTLYRAIIGKS